VRFLEVPVEARSVGGIGDAMSHDATPAPNASSAQQHQPINRPATQQLFVPWIDGPERNTKRSLLRYLRCHTPAPAYRGHFGTIASSNRHGKTATRVHYSTPELRQLAM
jgi:hypothetical protein